MPRQTKMQPKRKNLQFTFPAGNWQQNVAQTYHKYLISPHFSKVPAIATPSAEN